MDKKKNIIEKLKKFKSKVNKDYPLNSMIFFGSLATRKPHKYSDVDLIIVSPKFRKLNFFKRGARMYDYWDLRMPVDFLCYSPEEFKRLSRQTTIVKEAIREGIKI